MAAGLDKLYLVKDFESIFESNYLTDDDCQNLKQPEYNEPFRVPPPVHIADITFKQLNEIVQKTSFGTPSQELSVVKEIVEEFNNKDPNRKFACVLLRQYDNLHRFHYSHWQLCYSAQFNQNLLRSVCVQFHDKIQVQLRCHMQEYRLDKWCPWNIKDSTYNFDITPPCSWETMYREENISTKKIRCEEVEAVDLIRQRREGLRIKFELDIILVRNPRFPLAPKVEAHNQLQPMKLGENILLQALYENDATKDIRFIVGDGIELKAHKCILAAHSEVFQAMVASKMKEGESGVIQLVDISEAAMRELIRYFYGLEIAALDLNCGTAMELFQAAHKYKLKELELATISLFLIRHEKWYGADVALELYYYTKNMPGAKILHNHVLKILSRIPFAELRNCKSFKELSSSDVKDLSFELIEILQVVPRL